MIWSRKFWKGRTFYLRLRNPVAKNIASRTKRSCGPHVGRVFETPALWYVANCRLNLTWTSCGTTLPQKISEICEWVCLLLHRAIRHTCAMLHSHHRFSSLNNARRNWFRYVSIWRIFNPLFSFARCRHGTISSFFGDPTPNCDKQCDHCQDLKAVKKQYNDLNLVSLPCLYWRWQCKGLIEVSQLARSVHSTVWFHSWPREDETTRRDVPRSKRTLRPHALRRRPARLRNRKVSISV